MHLILSINAEVNIFLLAICVGFGLAAIYDLLRILRRVYKHKNLIVNIEDFIYWMFTVCILFEFLRYKNFGELRGFILIGCIIGATIYFSVLSKYIISVGVTVFLYINSIIKKIFKKFSLLLEKIKVLYNKRI